MADIAKSRAKARLKNKGLTPDLIDINAFESAINDNDSPGIEMIDEEINRLIAKARLINPTSEESIVIDLSTSQENSRIPATNIPQEIPVTTERKPLCPPELQKVVKAEERRAAQMSANLEICIVAINGFEDALAHLTTSTRNDFVVSFKVYLKNAIVQFMRSGTSAIPPTLPCRPTCPPPAVLALKNTARSTPTTKACINHPAKNQINKSWANIAQKGHQKSPNIINISQNHSTVKISAKIINKKSAPLGGVMRLFLRISKDHDWQLLVLCGVREVLCIHLKCSPSDITNITRTPTGFTLTSKDEETRQKLLNNYEELALQISKLEPASDLITYRIATVPVALRTPNGTVIVEETNLAAEITRVTNVIPRMVRQHGKTRAGAPYRSWLTNFARDQAPRPGFRLYDESGIAVIFKPRQPIQLRKRCFGFHITRSCSRTPACENCSSTMHIVTDCKAPTKCRIDQIMIRQISQREYHAEARAKAAIIRAEAAAINEETPPIYPKNNLDVILTNEVDMSEASIDVGTSSEIQL
ncbi:putative eka-like protein [Erysiphe necator]|uniref:Putative eka-like protein n=1 Tax=Uncinula necator TaxID=52586 RepID=A0A0B1PAE1_UNCNE|nr:putative eka-like protein [Erysiphe necator]